MRPRDRINKAPVQPPQIIPEERGEKVQYFLKKVQDKLIDLLDKDNVKISPNKIPFAIPEDEEQHQYLNQLKNIQQVREKMESRLKSLSEQEKIIMIKQQKKVEQSRIEKSRARSHLSHKDITLLLKLKQEQQQFQKNLQGKTLNFQQRIKEFQRQEQALREAQLKQTVEARKKEITQKLQQLSIQKTQREKLFEQQKRKLAEVKAKRKLHVQAQKKQKQLDRQQLQRKIQAMEERIKNRDVDIFSLREHDQRYAQIRVQQQAERQKKRQQLEELKRKHRKACQFEKSRYYSIVMEEQQKAVSDRLNEQREKKERLSAAKDYAEMIKRDHYPKLRTKSSESEQQPKKYESLSFEELKQQGNSYFEQMKRMVKRKMKKVDKASVSVDQSKTISTKYRDYLSQKRSTTNHSLKLTNRSSSSIKDRTIQRDAEYACKIVKEAIANREGLDRLSAITSKLEVYDKTDHQMLDKIAAKLKILESINNN